jgi:hypothetical protein
VFVQKVKSFCSDVHYLRILHAMHIQTVEEPLEPKTEPYPTVKLVTNLKIFVDP